MIDLYLFNTIANTIWYIFTILFVLYKFTSFFSYTYNFIKFCGKLFTWIKYLYDQIVLYIKKRQGYTLLQTDDLEYQPITPNQSIYQKIKQYFHSNFNHYYKRFFKRTHNSTSAQHTDIPLTETISTSVQTNIKNESYYNKSSEQEYFDKKMDDLCNNSSIMFDSKLNDDHNNHNMFHSVNLNDTHLYYDINYSIKSDINFKPNLTSNLIKNNLNYSNSDVESSVPLLYVDNSNQNSSKPLPYNMENSNMLFNSEFISNAISGTNNYLKRESISPVLNIEKKQKVDLSYSVNNNNENKNEFNEEITKNPYI